MEGLKCHSKELDSCFFFSFLFFSSFFLFSFNLSQDDFIFYWSIALLQVVLVSTVQRSDSAIHIHIPPLLGAFFSHLGHHRALHWVPCGIQWVLLSYLFIQYRQCIYEPYLIHSAAYHRIFIKEPQIWNNKLGKKWNVVKEKSSFSPPQHTSKTLPFPYTSSRKTISADREGVPATGIRKTRWHRKAWGICSSMCWWLDGRSAEGRCAGTAGLSGWKLMSIRDPDWYRAPEGGR